MDSTNSCLPHSLPATPLVCYDMLVFAAHAFRDHMYNKLRERVYHSSYGNNSNLQIYLYSITFDRARAELPPGYALHSLLARPCKRCPWRRRETVPGFLTWVQRCWAPLDSPACSKSERGRRSMRPSDPSFPSFICMLIVSDPSSLKIVSPVRASHIISTCRYFYRLSWGGFWRVFYHLHYLTP